MIQVTVLGSSVSAAGCPNIQCRTLGAQVLTSTGMVDNSVSFGALVGGLE